MKYPKGHEFDYKPLRPSQIRFDELYQRELDKNRVEKIVKEFDGDTFNEPKVSYRDGAYWCFDGQHSTAAWRKINDGLDVPLLCKVFHGMTWLEEADAFVKQNGLAKDPTTLQKLRTCYNSNRPDVKEMVEGAELAGFKVTFTKNKNGRNISAVGALFKAYQKLGYSRYLDMLTAIAEAWQYDPDSTLQQIISGMAEFYYLYAGRFKREDLVAKLRREALRTLSKGFGIEMPKSKKRDPLPHSVVSPLRSYANYCAAMRDYTFLAVQMEIEW